MMKEISRSEALLISRETLEKAEAERSGLLDTGNRIITVTISSDAKFKQTDIDRMNDIVAIEKSGMHWLHKAHYLIFICTSWEEVGDLDWARPAGSTIVAGRRRME